MSASRIVAVLFAVVALAMLGSFFWAGSRQGLGAGLGAIVREPWGLVTVIDVYAGVLAVAGWILLTESCPWRRTIWIVALFGLGHFITVTYVALRAWRSSSLTMLVLPRAADRAAA